MTKAGYKLSQGELAGAPSKFSYEVGMFRFCHDSLKSMSTHDNHFNAMLEAALLHLRNIHDFFCSPETGQNDIQARHFIPHPLTAVSACLPSVIAHQEQINKYLSHLTYTRTLMKATWNLEAFRDEVEQACAKFLELLPEGERNQWTA